MRCPVCATETVTNDRSCQTCGTKFTFQRVLFGANRREFSLTPEEEGWESGDDGRVEALPVPEARDELQYETRLADHDTTSGLQWGGFVRRLFAFLIDLVVVFVLCAILFVLCLIGYKVGLAAYGRMVSAENSQGLLTFLVGGWMFLTTSYFVLFHGMEGQTVGKWLLGLRVIGEHGAPLTYKRATLRWLSEIFLAPFVVGILWIIWSREKRAWHDYLAQSWVVKE
jgi:uncharacterized RDD family membrane protein YckC